LEIFYCWNLFGAKEPYMHEDKEILERLAGLLDEDIDRDYIEGAVSGILKAIGEDPEREGLLKTPERVAKAYDELLSGYRTDPIQPAVSTATCGMACHSTCHSPAERS